MFTKPALCQSTPKQVSLDVSFDNMEDCKGVEEKAEEYNRTKAYITHDEI
jgi:hypothetical protein